LKALKERLKKPGEDVADQWADRNADEVSTLIKNETNAEEKTDTKQVKDGAGNAEILI